MPKYPYTCFNNNAPSIPGIEDKEFQSGKMVCSKTTVTMMMYAERDCNGKTIVPPNGGPSSYPRGCTRLPSSTQPNSGSMGGLYILAECPNYPGSIPVKKKTIKTFYVKHKIRLNGIKTAIFNASPKLKKSFKQALASMLKVSMNNITHVRACKVGATEEECPATVKDRRRFLAPEADNSEVRYQVATATPEKSEELKTTISSPVFKDSDSFEIEFKKDMQTNNVDPKIVEEMKGVVTDAPPEAAVKETPAADKGPPVPEGSEADQENASNKDVKPDNTIMYAIVSLVAVGTLVAAAFVVYTKKKNKNNANSTILGANQQNSSSSFEGVNPNAKGHKREWSGNPMDVEMTVSSTPAVGIVIAMSTPLN